MAWDDIPRKPEEQRGFDLVGATIRRKRRAHGWSQRTLEAYSGIDQTVISRLENGKQYGLRWVRFARLVDALDGLEAYAMPRSESLDRRSRGARPRACCCHWHHGGGSPRRPRNQASNDQVLGPAASLRSAATGRATRQLRWRLR